MSINGFNPAALSTPGLFPTMLAPMAGIQGLTGLNALPLQQGLQRDTFTAQTRPIRTAMVIDDHMTTFNNGTYIHGNDMVQRVLTDTQGLAVSRYQVSANDVTNGLLKATNELVMARRSGQAIPDALNISLYNLDPNDPRNAAIRANLGELAQGGTVISMVAGKNLNNQGPQFNQFVPRDAMGRILPNVFAVSAAGEQIPGANAFANESQTSQATSQFLGQLIKTARVPNTQGLGGIPSAFSQIPTGAPGFSSGVGSGNPMTDLLQSCMALFQKVLPALLQTMLS